MKIFMKQKLKSNAYLIDGVAACGQPIFSQTWVRDVARANVHCAITGILIKSGDVMYTPIAIRQKNKNDRICAAYMEDEA